MINFRFSAYSIFLVFCIIFFSNYCKRSFLDLLTYFYPQVSQNRENPFDADGDDNNAFGKTRSLILNRRNSKADKYLNSTTDDDDNYSTTNEKAALMPKRKVQFSSNIEEIPMPPETPRREVRSAEGMTSSMRFRKRKEKEEERRRRKSRDHGHHRRRRERRNSWTGEGDLEMNERR